MFARPVKMIVACVMALLVGCDSACAGSVADGCGAVEHGIDYTGNDIKGVKDTLSYNVCQGLCVKTLWCKGFTWNKKHKICWLKHTMANRKRHPDGISMVVCKKDRFKCGEQQEYTDYPGNDIKAVRGVAGVDDCTSHCKATKGCKGFTWNKRNKNCWLKHTMKGRKYHPDGISKVSCKVKVPCDKKQARIDYPGNDIRAVRNVASFDLCFKECEGEVGCKGFTWNINNKNCWLKRKMKGRIEHPYGVSAVMCHPLKCNKSQKRIDYPGNDIKGVHNVPSFDACFDKCADTVGCKGFTWNVKNKICWLKHTMSNRKAHPDGVSSVLCKPLKCDKLQKHIDYPGNDIKGVHMKSPHMCMEECKRTKGCKGFTWNKQTKTCWLKHTMEGRKHHPDGISAVLCQYASLQSDVSWWSSMAGAVHEEEAEFDTGNDEE